MGGSDGRALVAQADALRIPLHDESVDLAVFSPPYFALRAYGAGPGEIGSEAIPAEFLAALWQVMGEVKRVLKPGGSAFVNLGDKYCHGGATRDRGEAEKQPWQRAYDQSKGDLGHGDARKVWSGEDRHLGADAAGVREKSLLGLPWAFALGCTGMLAALGGHNDALLRRELVADTTDRLLRDFPELDEDTATGIAERLTDDVTLPRVEALAGFPDPGLDLILRAGIVLWKQNSLPESVRDRVRTSDQELLFHFVKQPRYYSAIDELRQQTQGRGGMSWAQRLANGQPIRQGEQRQTHGHGGMESNPLGKLPGSVWPMTSEPLDLPGYFVMEGGRLLDFLAPSRGGARPRPNGHHPGLFDADAYREVIASGDGPAWRWARATGVTTSPWPQTDGGLQLRVAASHYAAFPSRLPELIIRGWSPPGICVECEQGRWPVVERGEPQVVTGGYKAAELTASYGYGNHGTGGSTLGHRREATILGYACACTPFTDHPGTGEGGGWGSYDDAGLSGAPAASGKQHVPANYRPKVGPWREYHLAGWTPPPTRPAVVLDCFGGVGTSAMVAKALGRIGLSFDLSFPYCRAANWRIHHSGNAGKAISRTNLERQQVLL